jgi:hypothetical protein
MMHAFYNHHLVAYHNMAEQFVALWKLLAQRYLFTSPPRMLPIVALAPLAMMAYEIRNTVVASMLLQEAEAEDAAAPPPGGAFGFFLPWVH